MRAPVIVTAVYLLGSMPSNSEEVTRLNNPALYVKALEKSETEVNLSEDRIKASLPELRYAKSSEFIPLSTTENFIFEGTDTSGFQVQVFSVPAMTFPGTDFALAYLLDPKGRIVDWRSQWLYNRRGNLVTKFADVDNDGVKEFCFTCERFNAADEIIAAFSLKEQRLQTVIAEPVSTFTIEFTEVTLSDVIILRPQLQGALQWKTGKLYEIPVRIQNLGKEARSLLDCTIWFTEQFDGGGTHGNLAVEELKPNVTVDTIITARFTEAPTVKQFGFKINKLK